MDDELNLSTTAPAYGRLLERAIKKLPIDSEAKANCRMLLTLDALDDLKHVFEECGVPMPREEPELGEWATGKWTLLERLQALASFAPILSDPDFKAGEWKGGTTGQWPWFDLNEKASSLLQALYDFGWVLGTDWATWMKTDEARRLSTDPAALELATPVQLAKVLTVSARRDRFMEGSFAGDIKSGLIGRVVQRALLLEEAVRSRLGVHKGMASRTPTNVAAEASTKV